MKNFIKITTFIVFGMSISSCSDYLDVQPEDKYIQDQVFSSEQAINNVLNGIYLSLAKSSLYGGNLTMSFVEVLGQRYNLDETRDVWYAQAKFDYTQSNVKANIDAIWSAAYISILNINNLIEGMETQDVMPTATANLLKGEALGLRALLHFDLLRLFGPIYSESPENLSIPYYTKAKAESSPILPAEQVMTLVLADLVKAQELLADDSIITNGPSGDLDDPFYQNRNRRMNAIAVKALMARVKLYAGDNAGAYAAAKSVIDENASYFPWTEPTAVLASSSPDRVFSSEVLLGIENLGLYDSQKLYFASDLQENNILAPNSNRLVETFEGNENDYRYNPSWIVPSVGAKNYRTFYKYADVDNKGASFRFLQPLIRLTEMYYIAAETTTDGVEALELLNTVRFNRGLIDLPDGSNIGAEIEKEYRKEFYGEGQMFFYYKRKNIDRIPDGSRPYSYFRITMGPEKYVLPLPDSESQFNN